MEKLLDLEAKAVRLHGRKPGRGDYVICCGDLIGADPAVVKPKDKAAVAYKIASRQRRQKKTHLERRKPFFREDFEFLDWVKRRPYTLLSTFGNHDPRTLVEKLAIGESIVGGSPVIDLGGNLSYLIDSNVYDIPAGDGRIVSICPFGGAIGHITSLMGQADSPVFEDAYYHSWLPLPSRHIDAVISHECPYGKSGMLKIYRRNCISTALDKVEQELYYDRWICGHHHIDLEPSDGVSCLYNRILVL